MFHFQIQRVKAFPYDKIAAGGQLVIMHHPGEVDITYGWAERLGRVFGYSLVEDALVLHTLQAQVTQSLWVTTVKFVYIIKIFI